MTWTGGDSKLLRQGGGGGIRWGGVDGGRGKGKRAHERKRKRKR